MFLRFISVSIFSKRTYVTFCSPKSMSFERTPLEATRKLQEAELIRNLFGKIMLGSLHIQNSCSKPNVMFHIVKLHQRRLTCLGFLHFTRFSKISRIHCRCFKILKTTKSSKLNVISLCTKKFLCLFLRTADGKENILRFVYYNIKFCQGSDGEENINLR